ncbi:MAG TPA: carbon-nitrogen hydrolase family protein [Turneriella sp.]|nr:carbon-nitrogen hydrolase family protein [Turneriella sp.]
MTFTSATVQFKPRWGAVADNRKAIGEIITQCAAHGVQLLVLPEMCTTGYVFHDRAEVLPFCEPRDGESFAFFSALAKQHGMYIVYGFAERDSEQLYNSQNLLAPTGERIVTYRKTHLYKADVSWATPGDTGFLRIDTALGRLGLGICMDMNFDDFVDYHQEHGTDIVCFSACWLDEDFPVHNYWLYRLDGYENSILIANSFGEERGIRFRGESAIIHGSSIIAAAPTDGQGVLLAQHNRAENS